MRLPMGSCPGQKRLATVLADDHDVRRALQFGLVEGAAGEKRMRRVLKNSGAHAVDIGARGVLRGHRRLSFGGKEDGAAAGQRNVGADGDDFDGGNLRDAPHDVAGRHTVRRVGGAPGRRAAAPAPDAAD